MIIIKGRELLIPENERYIGTTYDDNSTVRTFRIPRFHEDGMDKSQLDFYVIINYDDGSDPDAVGVTKSVSDDYIVLEWDVSEDITEHSGCLFLWVRGFDYTGAVRWSSFPGVFYIEDSGTEPSDLSDLEQRISEEDKLLRLAKLYKSQPMTAATVAEIKYRDRIYVYVGDEDGYAYGDWYFWNGTAWVPGGVYNSIAIQTDTELIAPGVAADAKAVGDEFTDLKNHSAWYVTPEDFGANTDDEAIRLCLAKAASEGKTAILGGVYSTSMPVEVSTGGQIVYINQINYTGNNSALVVSSGNNTIIAKQIASNGNGIEVVTDGRAVLNNSITVKSVDSAKHAIYLHTEEYGIAYNRIEFNWLRAASGYNGIMCVASGDITKEAAFIGETVFYGGRLLGGDWGIYAQTNRQNSEITALKLNDFCFEGSDNCIHFDGVAYSYINSPRYAETQEQAENGIVWELTGNCAENVLTGERYIRLDKLSYANSTNTQYNANKVNCMIRNSGLSPVAKSALIYNGKIILDPVVTRRVTVSSSTYAVSDTDIRPTYFYVTASTATITLNDSYCPMGINEIMVQMDSGKTAIVKDASGDTIFDGTGRYPGIYRLYCYDVSGTTNWRFEYTFPTLKTLLKSASISGITTSAGMLYVNEIVAGWNRDNVIVGVKINNVNGNGVVCALGGQHGDNMRITNNSGAVVANTAVSGTIYYFEY